VSIGVLAEIGVLLLLLAVGMEMDLAELGKVGRPSLVVAVIGVAAPFAVGTLVGLAFGEPTETAVFFGAALTATSVGITARVFGDLRALATIEARIVLGAAVADDVLGLVILTVVTKVVTGGDVGVGLVAETLGLAVAFLLVTGLIGVFAVPKALDLVHRRATSGATVVVAAMAITLGFAMLADAAKLAFIIGAFMAGLGLGRSQHHERIAREHAAGVPHDDIEHWRTLDDQRNAHARTYHGDRPMIDPTIDPTEAARRAMLEDTTRTAPDDRMSTVEMSALYDVVGFLAPFVVVVRKSDGVKGSLEFTHSPRFYFGFKADV
jgi:hypothetical protein